jgi:hypothetical protein
MMMALVLVLVLVLVQRLNTVVIVFHSENFENDKLYVDFDVLWQVQLQVQVQVQVAELLESQEQDQVQE